jgi:RNA polymerase sigma factor (sigma-70 family)
VNRYSSLELINGIRKRDNTVLRYIYSKYYQSVLHFVMNNSGTAEDAKDVFQESMIVVFENVRADIDFKLDCSMQTYVFSIARIIWIKHLNRIKKNMTKLNENHEYIDFEEPQPFKEHDFQYALYQKVFLELPEDCQVIAKRKHFCKEYLIKLIRENPEFHSDKL